MKDILEQLCRDSIYSKITSCKDYKTNECLMTCGYAKRRKEQEYILTKTINEEKR